MDHFSLGGTTNRHQQIGNGNSSKFNFSSGGRQQHNPLVNNINGGGGGNSSQQHLQYNFSTPVFPHSLIRRGVNPTSFLNPTPPNHFNFPLRSDTNSSSLSAGRGGAYLGIGAGRNNNANHNLNKSRPNNNNLNNGNSSQGSSSNSSSTRTQLVQEPSPQYRIFKRGDSIPGIMSPTGVNSTGGGEANNDGDKMSDLQLGNSSDVAADKLELTGQNNKENDNTGGRKDITDPNSTGSATQPNKTPVSQVSDIARFHNLTVEYRLVGEKGPPHNPTFTVALHLGQTENYVGQGTSIKRAQHAAAIEALEKTTLLRPTSRSQPKRPFAGKRPNWALLQLTALAEELKEPVSIAQRPITIMNPFQRGDSPSVVSVHVGERIFSAEGPNFNTAKNLALMIALKAMMKVKQETRKLGAAGGEEAVNMENKSPISVVHELAMKRDLAVNFEVINEEGPPHSKVFTVICSLGAEEEHKTEGQGATKQAAKKVASELMIEKLLEMPIYIKGPESTSLKAIQRGLFRQKSPRKKSSVPVVKDLQKAVSVSPISRLIQIAHIRKYKEPEFNLIHDSSTVNALPEDPIALKLMSERERRSLRKKKPSFTIEVIVGPYSSQGTGPNKKAAKKAAADAVLIDMGYGVNESEDNDASGISNESNNGAHEKKSGGKTSGEMSKNAKSKENSKSLSNSGVSARQIGIPGILVLSSSELLTKKDSPDGSPTKSSTMAQEMKKMNTLGASSSASSSSNSTFRDGIQKLAYLANLLDVSVSYSDFPKKNEFLSVVSIGTNPPQVAHGCGATLEESQNMAAIKILEDLSNIGLDNVKPSENGSSA